MSHLECPKCGRDNMDYTNHNDTFLCLWKDCQYHTSFKVMQAELEKCRWILVSEGLPKENECDDVLFISEGLVEAGEFKNGLFFDNSGHDYKNITHWKHIILPKKE